MSRVRSTDDSRPAGERLEALAQLFECRPAAVDGVVVMPVRLDVQVAAAHGTEAGAVGAAEDLVRERERDRVARPGREVETVGLEVWRPQLLGLAGIRRLVLAGGDRDVEDGVGEAPIAGAVEPSVEAQLEDGSGAGARDGELGRE